VPSAVTVIWVIDSSSIIELPNVPNVIRPQVVATLDALVGAGRLIYPRHVLDELKEYAGGNPKVLKTDVAYSWAKKHEAKACHGDRLLAEGKAILKAHPDLIEPDSSGKDPADPYVIALAEKLRGADVDVRIVTDDTRQVKSKVSVAAVSGLMGIPSTPMRIFLRGEGHNYTEFLMHPIHRVASIPERNGQICRIGQHHVEQSDLSSSSRGLVALVSIVNLLLRHVVQSDNTYQRRKNCKPRAQGGAKYRPPKIFPCMKTARLPPLPRLTSRGQFCGVREVHTEEQGSGDQTARHGP